MTGHLFIQQTYNTSYVPGIILSTLKIFFDVIFMTIPGGGY